MGSESSNLNGSNSRRIQHELAQTLKMLKKDNHERFSDVYRMGERIGSGSFATVHQCLRKSDNMWFAVKIITKKHLSESELSGLQNEIRVLLKTNHENIIKFIDIFDDGKIVRIVLELCSGKDLFDLIINSKHQCLKERKAAKIVYALCNGLKHLNDRLIIHRDLKPENILFGMDGKLKIIDFGCAHIEPLKKVMTSGHEQVPSIKQVFMKTFCGTREYMAPEVIRNDLYTYKADMWSLGVILFVMLAGYQPFGTESDSLSEMYENITKKKPNFGSARWQHISQDARHLVQCLLAKDPTKRYSVRNIKKHPWIQKYVRTASVKGEEEQKETEELLESNGHCENIDDAKEECTMDSLQSRYNKLRGNMNYVRNELSEIVKMEESEKAMLHIKELNETVSQYVYV